MKTRILKNWQSSVLGLIFLIFGGFLVWFGKIEFEVYVGFIPFCLGLIYVQDSIFKRTCKK